MNHTAAHKNRTAKPTNEYVTVFLANKTLLHTVREFFSAYSYEVIASDIPHTIPVYRVIAGDVEYVKKFLANTTKPVRKSIIILANATRQDIDELNSYGTFVVHVNEKNFPTVSMKSIFTQMIATPDSAYIIDPPTQMHPRKQPAATPPKPVISSRASGSHEPIQHNFPAIQTNEQQHRIRKEIQSIYGPQDKQTEDNATQHTGNRTVRLLPWIAIGILSPLLYQLFLITTGTMLLVGSLLILDTNRDMAYKSAVAADAVLSHASEATILFAPLSDVPFVSSVLRNHEVRLDILRTADSTALNALRIAGSVEAIRSHLLLQQTGEIQDSIVPSLDRVINMLPDFQVSLGLLSSSMTIAEERRVFPFNMPFIGSHLSTYRVRLDRWSDMAHDFGILLSLYKRLGGFDGQRRYLVLLQNSAELRPTGGFIGSVAELVLSDGRIGQLTVRDVYELDGQLKGHVDPPAPIPRFLGQEHWYLRDSNWDPDFFATATMSAWFYEKESGNTVDGVFAVTTGFIQKILKATGPVRIPDYDDTVAYDTFLEKTLYYTKDRFFPGSTQKGDFLGSLSVAVTDALGRGVADELGVINAVTDSLSSYDVQLAPKDPVSLAIIRRQGWGGPVFDLSSCNMMGEKGSAGACIADGAFLVDANMGMTKTNSYLESAQYTGIEYTDAVTSYLTRVTIRNASAGDEPGGGPYTSYSRIFVPQDAASVGIRINGVPVPTRPGSAEDIMLPYQDPPATEGSTKIIGFGYTILPGETAVIDIEYKRNMTFDAGSTATIDLRLPRQAGTGTSSHAVRLSFPSTWTIGETADWNRTTLANTTVVEYNSSLPRDIRLSVPVRIQ